MCIMFMWLLFKCVEAAEDKNMLGGNGVENFLENALESEDVWQNVAAARNISYNQGHCEN